MAPQVITGSKQEIARKLVGIQGEVREAIVFFDDPAPTASSAAETFAEMDSFTVRQAPVDDSRDAIYRPAEGE